MTNNFTESDFEFGDFFLHKKRESETSIEPLRPEKNKQTQRINLHY